MSLSVCSIASGSRGNCILVRGADTALLIDVGIPLDALERALADLGMSARDLSGVLITHEHGDHTGGLSAFCRRFPVPVYMHERAAAGIKRRIRESRSDLHHVVFGDGDFLINTLVVSPVRLSHDVPCTGYSIRCGGEKFSLITDLGKLPDDYIQAVGDSDILMIESNHDPVLLRASTKYPAALKRRILSEEGHLSNAVCAEAVVNLYGAGRLKRVILAHLSAENNYESLALSTLRAAFARAGMTADGLQIDVAKQDQITGFLTAEYDTVLSKAGNG
jgi:phosphoribosyl 1,2-cyclic phosphodiesterase